MMKKLLHFALFAAMAVSGALAYASTNDTGVGMATQATTSAGTSVQAIDSTLGSGGHAVMSKVAHKSDLAFTGGGGANADTSSVMAMTDKSGWGGLGSQTNVATLAGESMAAATIIVIGTTLLASASTHHGLSAGVAATSADKFGSIAGNYTDAKST